MYLILNDIFTNPLKTLLINSKKIIMKAPSAPKQITWIIGLICGILGIVGHYTDVPFLTEHNYTLLLVGFIALAAGTTFRDM